MIYQEGYVYHIKDEYFEKVRDSNLMQNKEGGTYRPTFYCLRDNKTSLLWMVPLSSRVEKFKAIHSIQGNTDIFKVIVSIYNQFLFNVVFRQVL